MHRALELAREAAANNEVPVGALIVRDGHVLGEGHNTPISAHDPCAHAEINAIRDAARRVGNYRLTGATLYVTLEPCCMCAGAIVHSRLARVVYGADDPRAGAVRSKFELLTNPSLNHQCEWQAGLEAEVSAKMLKEFFASRR